MYLVHCAYILHSSCNFVLSIFCLLAFALLFVNFHRVTTLLKTLMHNYNDYLYHVVFIHILTLYIICNCSPDYMYIYYIFYIYCIILATWALAF